MSMDRPQPCVLEVPGLLGRSEEVPLGTHTVCVRSGHPTSTTVCRLPWEAPASDRVDAETMGVTRTHPRSWTPLTTKARRLRDHRVTGRIEGR